MTAVGRVLDVCAWAPKLGDALDKARAAAAKIRFEGMHFRTDIGRRALDALLDRTASGLS